MDHLRNLKQIGHDLLDEYISLDISYCSRKKKKEHAYDKLAHRLGVAVHRAHFSQMTTALEIQTAITTLERMIEARRKKTEYMATRKGQVAPNVMELQRMASNLNTKSI